MKHYLTNHIPRTNHILTSKRHHKIYIDITFRWPNSNLSFKWHVWQLNITCAFVIMWKKASLKFIVCSQISLQNSLLDCPHIGFQHANWYITKVVEKHNPVHTCIRPQVCNQMVGLALSSKQIIGPQLKTTGLSLPPLNPWEPILLVYKIVVKQIWRRTLESRPQKAQNKTSERVSGQKPVNIVHAPHNIRTKPSMNIMDPCEKIIAKKIDSSVLRVSDLPSNKNLFIVRKIPKNVHIARCTWISFSESF